MRRRSRWPLTRAFAAGTALFALLAAGGGLAIPAGASAHGPDKVVHYRGQRFRVPASWPVYRLARRPAMCARLDRRAVYLGAPGPSQRCPAHVVGRRRAIVIGERPRAGASAAPAARVAASASFTGLGFDACAAPSRRAMTAWLSSPYRAIGVYVGGINRACSQPNLTANWVGDEIVAGWNLIPTYVGLQAPTSSCSSCAKFGTKEPRSKGVAAANDAVDHARGLGIGPGSPVYFDLESYSRTSSATKAVLAFLAGWTSRLRALGYLAGVYSSARSGITDLVNAVGTGYAEPDDIWIANWNGKATAKDPYVPSDLWSGRRLRQYRGGHNERYGGVTINIDNDYVAGATAGSSSPSPDDPKGGYDSVDSPGRGQVRIVGWAFDPDAPTATLAITAYVGGKAGGRGAKRYDLGAVADLPRSDVGTAHPEAGEDHGFDATFITTKTGKQPVCLYAVNVGAGSDRRLGCKTVEIAVPITLSHISSGARALRVTVGCKWPAGTRCAGRITVHARMKLSQGPRATVVGIGLARQGFDLAGGSTHALRLALNKRARPVLSSRRIKARLKLTIPGIRLHRSIVIGRRK